MIDMKVNYQGSHTDLLCDLCGKHEDSQQSLLICEKLIDSTGLVGELPVYNDLFAPDVQKQINISSILKKKFELRNKLIEQLKNKT